MTPNDVLRYAHDPTGHASIAAVDKLPTAPLLLSGGRTRFIGIVIWTAAEWFFTTIVPLAGKKGAATHVVQKIGFERPVLIRV